MTIDYLLSRPTRRLRSLRDFCRKQETQRKERVQGLCGEDWMNGYDRGAASVFEQIADELDELLKEAETWG